LDWKISAKSHIPSSQIHLLLLVENGIAGLEDITEVELTIEAENDNYKTVAKPVVTVTGK